MLGGHTVIDRQGPAAGRAPAFGDQVPMAVERSDHVAAAMQEQNDFRCIGAGGGCPLGFHAVGGDRFDNDIGRQAEAEAPGVVVATHFRQFGGAGAGGDLGAQGDDFRIGHGESFCLLVPWSVWHVC